MEYRCACLPVGRDQTHIKNKPRCVHKLQKLDGLRSVAGQKIVRRSQNYVERFLSETQVSRQFRKFMRW